MCLSPPFEVFILQNLVQHIIGTAQISGEQINTGFFEGKKKSLHLLHLAHHHMCNYEMNLSFATCGHLAGWATCYRREETALTLEILLKFPVKKAAVKDQTGRRSNRQKEREKK